MKENEQTINTLKIITYIIRVVKKLIQQESSNLLIIWNIIIEYFLYYNFY